MIDLRIMLEMITLSLILIGLLLSQTAIYISLIPLLVVIFIELYNYKGE